MAITEMQEKAEALGGNAVVGVGERSGVRDETQCLIAARERPHRDGRAGPQRSMGCTASRRRSGESVGQGNGMLMVSASGTAVVVESGSLPASG